MSENGKAKFAMYWAASCGGCEIAVLNIHEKILDVDANFDVGEVADHLGCDRRRLAVESLDPERGLQHGDRGRRGSRRSVVRLMCSDGAVPRGAHQGSSP